MWDVKKNRKELGAYISSFYLNYVGCKVHIKDAAIKEAKIVLP